MDVTYLKNASVWQQMSRISLDEMKTVQLMSRIDTKYVAGLYQLRGILERAAQRAYSVQFTGSTLNEYDTTYYDTPELEMYIRHHNRKLRRAKVRCRTYTDSAISFFEIKKKNNKGRTDKVRIRVAHPESDQLHQETTVNEFLKGNTPYTMDGLVAALRTRFYRITLVNRERTERITIDVGLTFENFLNGNSHELNDFIIIELKRDGNYPSTMAEILREMRIKSFKFSKYCMGTALTNPTIKSNRFKRKIHLMNKMKQEIALYNN